jgi:RNA recognition motif-containing protein
MTDKDSGRSRGFAYVDFFSRDAAQRAMADMAGQDLGGRPLKIDDATRDPAGGPGY